MYTCTVMIFSVRQRKRSVCSKEWICNKFVNLTKAFDTVNRIYLWEILRNLGDPEKFINMFQCFHDGMKAWVNVGSNLCEPFDIKNGVKPGDVPAPILFALYNGVLHSNQDL